METFVYFQEMDALAQLYGNKHFVLVDVGCAAHLRIKKMRFKCSGVHRYGGHELLVNFYKGEKYE